MWFFSEQVLLRLRLTLKKVIKGSLLSKQKEIFIGLFLKSTDKIFGRLNKLYLEVVYYKKNYLAELEKVYFNSFQ